MNRSQRRFGYQCVFAMAAAGLLVTPAGAQQGNIRSVSFATVKPDRNADFLAATKEYSGVLTKGGSDRYYYVWHSLIGANEYALVNYYAKWADLDVAPEPKMKEQAVQMQSIGMRISQCIESSHRVIDELLPDLSLPQGGDVPMVRVLRNRVRPDKVSEFRELLKNEALPAAKKAGLSVYTVSQTRYGSPSTEFVTVAGMKTWADLDGGGWAQKAMGEEGYQRFLARRGALIMESDATINRLVPESSYMQVAAGK